MATLEQIETALRNAHSMASSAETEEKRSAARDAARRLAVAYRKQSARSEMEHPPTSVIGPSAPGEVSDESLSFSQRIAAGRAGNPEELAAQLGGGRGTQKGDVRYWKPSEDKPWIRVNPPGFDWGDVGQFFGEFGPQTLGAAAMQLIPAARTAGLLGQVASAGFGGAAGKFTDEAAQYIGGQQRETPEEIGMNIARSGVEEGIGGGLGALMARWAPSMRGSNTVMPGTATHAGASPGFLSDMDLVNSVVGSGQLPKPMTGDILSETGLINLGDRTVIPGNVLSGAFKQADAMIGSVSRARDVAAADGARSYAAQAPAAMERKGINDRLVGAAESAYQSLYKDIGRLPDGEAGATAGNRALELANKKLSAFVNTAYNKVDATAIKEKPEFDFSKMQSKLKQESTLTRTELVNSGAIDPVTGAPIMETIERKINVMERGPAQLQYVRDVVAAIDPKQTNYDAIKRLRTRVGRMVKEWPYATTDSKIASGFYKDLSSVLLNPTNDAPEYVTAMRAATDIARKQFSLQESKAVREVASSEGTSGLIKRFASNYEELISPKFRELLALAPREERDKFRLSIWRAIITEKDPTEIVRKMELDSPGTYKFLFETPKQAEAFNEAAKTVSQWWNSPEGKMFAARSKPMETMKLAVGELQTPQQTNELLSAMSADNKQAFKQAAMDDFVNSTLTKYNERTGDQMVDPGAVRKKVFDWKRNGIWDSGVLSTDEKKKLLGFEAYYRRFLRTAKDVGVSLQTQSAVADLKGILTGQVGDVAEGLHTISQNAIVAKLLSDTGAYERLFRRTMKLSRDKRPFVLPMLAFPGMAEIAIDNLEGK